MGCAIAKLHCDVLTGGYIGTMEAVSKGANDSGGHVIGITCDEIEAWRPVHPNQWIKEEIRFKTLHERLVYLVKMCDLAVALPGGIGTLAEIAFFWNCNATGLKEHRTLIFAGDAWNDLLAYYKTRFSEYIPEKDWEYLVFCPDVDSAIRKINGLIRP